MISENQIVGQISCMACTAFSRTMRNGRSCLFIGRERQTMFRHAANRKARWSRGGNTAMSLTKDFRDTVRARTARDFAFRAALLEQIRKLQMDRKPLFYPLID